MCDPLVGGLIAGAASIASAGIQQSQNEALAQKQQQANDQWVAYQTKIHREQAAAEDQAREAANNAREATLQKVSPQNQQQEQTTEQQRLQNEYTDPGRGVGATGGPVDPNTVSNTGLLSGSQTGDQAAKASMTSQINTATAAARQRIGALATANSYGGSFGGLGNVVPQQFTQGGNYINMVNDIRQGNLKTYGVEQQVQPLQYTSTGGNMFGSLATALGGLAGKGIGAGMAGGGLANASYFGDEGVPLGGPSNPLPGLSASDYPSGFF